MKHRAYCDSAIGILEIIADDKFILAIDFVKTRKANNHNALTKRCVVELKKYFLGKRKSFLVPYKFSGSEFQNKVYTALAKIPYGAVISYGDLAKMIAKPKAARAVGQAVNKNKIAIIVPCHRVVGSDANLVAYASGLWRKKRLLALENGVLTNIKNCPKIRS
ncbi:MAG: methylated-DNA--[protein]-cysteine S-methyltransferase [bacterium]|nr:methylated-DNA--[protein]-cysteine S-methyltransferase [bacterium]